MLQTIAEDDFKKRNLNFYSFLGQVADPDKYPDHLVLYLTAKCFGVKLSLFGPSGSDWSSDAMPAVGLMMAYVGKGQFNPVKVGVFHSILGNCNDLFHSYFSGAFFGTFYTVDPYILTNFRSFREI